MSQKMKEPPKRANHKGKIKFLNPSKPPPVMRSIINLFIINGQSKPNWSIPSRVILISDEIRFYSSEGKMTLNLMWTFLKCTKIQLCSKLANLSTCEILSYRF
jgi:hypothetical protein